MPSPTTRPSIYSLRPHPHLHEINTWAWLDQLSARSGRQITLAEVPDSEWSSFAELGFDIVWLMGVWQRSPESRRIALEDPANFADYDRALPGWTPEDVIASPYAVAAYLPDAHIGTWDAVDLVRKKLHARGMTLFLDFVGNHTALDHPWTREHPDFYVQGTREDYEENPGDFYPCATSGQTFFLARARDPYFPPWKDVAQLNHFHPGMRAAHLAELRTIAQHCDGVRCDMAMLQLNDIFGGIWGKFLGNARPPQEEFWTTAHRESPNFVLLAEAYWGTEAQLLELGFNFAYDKEFYDAVRDLDLGKIHNAVAASPDYQRHFARFLENHDEARQAAVFGTQRLTSVGTLMGTLPGMRFYYQGELEGRKLRLPITLRREADEPPDPAASAFFKKILAITKEEVFHTGNWALLPVAPEGDNSSANLVAYEWQSEAAWKLIVVNLEAIASQGRIPLANRVSPTKQYVFFDELNDVPYDRSGEELNRLGLFVRRDGFQAHAFSITPA
jgi:Alpha amylase, catalytic domain